MDPRRGHQHGLGELIANTIAGPDATVPPMTEEPMSERAKRPSRGQFEAMRRRVAELVNPDGRYKPLWPDGEREAREDTGG